MITVAISQQPVEKSLFRLATALVALSAAICIAALLMGRSLCRRALAPLISMATAAGEISADALDRRLPTRSAGDEVDHLGRSFNQLLNRLQESFERQKRFTGDASHQLRTPLAAILGQTEVALRRQRPPEEYERVLRSVHQSADHLRVTVESLLFLARADREAATPDLDEVNLSDWLASQLQGWQQHPRFNDIVLDASSGDCRVRVHPVLVGELINLLLDNACKYSQPGTPIHIGVERAESHVRLRVRDQGIGIREEDLARVFTPFFRASQGRHRVANGVGLGLSIAQRLAAAFGGSLSVTSEFGSGSSFVLTLPAALTGHVEVATTT